MDLGNVTIVIERSGGVEWREQERAESGRDFEQD
jgi:hypothetical protein